jgi:uncharacterized protein (DUF1778 family)
LVAAALERADRVLAQREMLHLDDTMRERFYSAVRAKPMPSPLLRQLVNEHDTRFKLVE